MTHPFTPPDPEEDPRDDDQREDDRCADIARLAASAVQMGEPGHEYTAHAILRDGWQPHPWVVRAIRTALEAGRQEGRAAVEAEHQLLANAMEEKFDAREHHLISSAFAVMLEEACGTAPTFDGNGRAHLTFDTERAKFIHDRYNVRYSLKGMSELTVTLEPK